MRKNGYDIYRCAICDIGATDLGEPYPQFVKRLYDKEYFTGGKTRNAYTNYQQDKPFILKNMNKFLRAIQKYKTSGKLLDVGCALGFFVELATQQGFEAYGLDPSAFAISEAKKNLKSLNEHFQQGTLSSSTYKKNSFDVITLFDVFEHVDDPAKTLKEAYALLKPGGIVVIATGDTGSIWAKLAKKHWTFYIPPQHLFFFNRKNIARFLERYHFQPLFFDKVGKWMSLEYVLHLAETAAMIPFSVQIQALSQRLKLQRFPMFLPIGDNMLVIAQKN